MPYTTMVMRVPEPCWEAIDDFCMRYRESMKVGQFHNKESRKLSEIASILDEYKKQAKTSRDWTKCTQLIQAIEEKIESA